MQNPSNCKRRQPYCKFRPILPAQPKAPLIDDASDGADEDAAAASIEEQIKAVKKMNRGELDTACAEHGIEVEDSDTIPTLQKKLIAKIQEG